jgi:hypothetical protein
MAEEKKSNLLSVFREEASKVSSKGPSLKANLAVDRCKLFDALSHSFEPTEFYDLLCSYVLNDPLMDLNALIRIFERQKMTGTQTTKRVKFLALQRAISPVNSELASTDPVIRLIVDYSMSALKEMDPVFFWSKGESSHELTWHGPLGENNYFNGVNCYASVPSSDALKLGVHQTLMAWVRPTHLVHDSNRIVGKGFLDVRNYGLWFSTDLMTLYQIQGALNLFGQTAALNVWFHFAATYDGMQMKMYINGELHVSHNENAIPPWTEDPLTIGYSPGYHSYFQGHLEGVAVFARALSYEEINAMMLDTEPNHLII